MTIGTRSVLFGAHAFWLHPLFVARAWTRLYGFPWDPRLWVAFFVHDLGYVGKSDMDGPDGEKHPYWGAALVHRWFDRRNDLWWRLVAYHSRYLAKKDHQPPSCLCFADKMALYLTPAWLYIPMVRATGELTEYMKLSRSISEHEPVVSPDVRDGLRSSDPYRWFHAVQLQTFAWVIEHLDKDEDTWTSRATKVGM